MQAASRGGDRAGPKWPAKNPPPVPADTPATPNKAEHEQRPAEPACRPERDAARGQRPLGPLLAVDLQVEHVVQHHARDVEQARCGDQQRQRPRVAAEASHCQSARLDEQEPHRHVGHGREDVRQPHQFEVAAEVNRAKPQAV